VTYSRITASLFGAALALTVTTAGAEKDIHNANHAIPSCRDFVNRANLGSSFEQGHCLGTIEGIAYMGVNLTEYRFSNDRLPLWARLHCMDVPDGVTGEQLVRVVVAYIDARPARMHELFDVLVIQALREAWPCR
jgi:hypothetical protein